MDTAMGSGQPAGLGAQCRAEGRSRVPAPWLALLAAPLSFGIAAPALVLADVAGATGTSVVAATWAVTAYGWGIAVGTPLMAGLLGRSGVRAALAVCGSLVLAGAVLVGVAPVVPLVAAGTALQGLGTAGLLGTAMTLADRARTLGLITALLAVVGATGPLIGSVVGDLVGWRVSLALPAVSLLAIPAVARRAGARAWRARAEFDGAGAVLLTALVTALVAVPHWPGPAVATAAAVVVLLAVHLRRRPDGFLPVALVRSPAFVLAAGTALFLAVVNFGIFYAAPTLLARLTGWADAQVGAVMLWPYLAGGALSWAVVAFSVRLGRRAVAAGLAALVVAAAVVAGFAAAVPVLLVAMVAGSLAASTGNGALAGHAAGAVPDRYRPVAIGLFNLCYLLGAAFGPAIVALMLAG